MACTIDAPSIAPDARVRGAAGQTVALALLSEVSGPALPSRPRIRNVVCPLARRGSSARPALPGGRFTVVRTVRTAGSAPSG